MVITEDKDESGDRENTNIANEENDVLMNDEEILSNIEENEEEDDSLNADIKSTGTEDSKGSEKKERVSSHGKPVRGILDQE